MMYGFFNLYKYNVIIANANTAIAGIVLAFVYAYLIIRTGKKDLSNAERLEA